MQVSISSITIPRAPPGICSKNLSLPWGFCILAFARGGWGFVGVAPEGRAFVYKQFLPFLEIPLQWQELATDNPLVFICCFEILYVLKENYSLKLKNQNHFSDQRLRM